MAKLLSALSTSLLRSTGYGILKPGDLDRLLAERSLGEKGRQDYILSHSYRKGNPITRLARVPARDLPSRKETARRLLAAYRLARQAEVATAFHRQSDDLWSELVKNELSDLLHILEGGDVDALASFLMHFGEDHTWFGGLTFSLDDYGFLENKDEARVALAYHDKLVCLAEALGVLPIEHPEHGRWGQNPYVDPQKIVEAIERHLGIAISPPDGVVHVVGIAVGDVVYHYRHLNAVYTAHLLSTLARPDAALAEYGGGLGAVALYARRLGILDYTLFDLPITNLFAGHFLINALGAEAVSLFGEEPKPASIKVVPFWTCAAAPENKFDVSLNQDSFPEIDACLVDRFFREIRRTTKRIFLSINHEAQSIMTDASRQLNICTMLHNAEGYRKLSRGKYWLREGYAQEVYEISK